MLTNEMKRKVFMKLRDENYVASLRLEGLPRNVAAAAKDILPPSSLKPANPANPANPAQPGKPILKDVR